MIARINKVLYIKRRDISELLQRILHNTGLAAVLLLSPVFLSAQTQTEHFDIERFTVTGNTLVDDDAIDAILRPYTGEKREYSDIQAAIESLRQYYRARGYSVVWVVAPEQELDQGIVTLHVIEALLGNVTITNNRYFDTENIRNSLPTLLEGAAPRAMDIAEDIQFANESPSKQVDVVLRPGTQAGVVDATIDVIDVRPLKAFLTFDNTGNPQTGDYRLGIGVQHSNLFNRDHVGTLNFSTAPDRQEKVRLYSGSYRLPMYSQGNSMDFILAYSDVSIGTTPTVAGPLNFSGKGAYAGIRFNQLLRRRGEYSHRLVYGIDYRAFENNCTLGQFGDEACGSAAADVTVMPVSVAYRGNWARPMLISDFYLSLSHNIPGVTNGKDEDFNAARPSPLGEEGAHSNYLILRLGASMVNAYNSNWQTRIAVNAQYTPDALVSGEQFGIAGVTAVRGFLEREFVRDTGIIGNLELYTPNLPGELIPGESNVRGLMFLDIAAAANQALAGETRRSTLISSLGAGLRWNIGRNFNLRFDMARVLDADGDNRAGDWRGHISVFLGY